MLDWVGLLNIIRASWRHQSDVWETRNVPVMCRCHATQLTANIYQHKAAPLARPGRCRAKQSAWLLLVYSMTAITKMFLSSSYSLSKNSRLHCVAFKIGQAPIRSAAAESLRWIHHCAVFAWWLLSPILCNNGVTESYLTTVAGTGDSGIPQHCVELHCLQHGFPQLKMGDRILTLNQVWSNFPAPPYNHSRNITHSLCVYVCLRGHRVARALAWQHFVALKAELVRCSLSWPNKVADGLSKYSDALHWSYCTIVWIDVLNLWDRTLLSFQLLARLDRRQMCL